jgi:hypothetical protein
LNASLADESRIAIFSLAIVCGERWIVAKKSAATGTDPEESLRRQQRCCASWRHLVQAQLCFMSRSFCTRNRLTPRSSISARASGHGWRTALVADEWKFGTWYALMVALARCSTLATRKISTFDICEARFIDPEVLPAGTLSGSASCASQFRRLRRRAQAASLRVRAPSVPVPLYAASNPCAAA